MTIARYRATTGATALLPTITGTWDELLAALPKLAGVAEGAGHGDRTDGGRRRDPRRRAVPQPRAPGAISLRRRCARRTWTTCAACKTPPGAGSSA